MERMPETSSAPDVVNGRELADTLYISALEAADTIGEVRRNLQNLVSEIGSNGEAGNRLTEITTSVNQASDSGVHDSIKLENTVGGNDSILGMNNLGQQNSVMRRDQFLPEQVVTHTRFTADTILHENSEEVGHAGQDSAAAATIAIIDDNGFHDAETMFEGAVVEGVAKELGVRREGLPAETYIEGADAVNGISLNIAKSYTDKGGANVGKHLQVEVWRRNSGIQFSEMLEQGLSVGMTEAQVIQSAQELGKFPKGSESVAELSA